MIEIESRGKNIDTGEWEYGYHLYVEEQNKHYILTGKLKSYPVDYVHHALTVQGFEWFEVREETVGQFIGICDKNKVKIYEGDMVKTKYGRVCVVVRFLSDCHNCWDLQPVNRFYDTVTAPDKYDLWKPENLEVVGNIYDNSDTAEDLLQQVLDKAGFTVWKRV